MTPESSGRRESFLSECLLLYLFALPDEKKFNQSVNPLIASDDIFSI